MILWFCGVVVCVVDVFFVFKQKTAYEMRISDWSSDVCSSDLGVAPVRAAEGDVGDTDVGERQKLGFAVVGVEDGDPALDNRADADAPAFLDREAVEQAKGGRGDRKSTRLNSSH